VIAAGWDIRKIFSPKRNVRVPGRHITDRQMRLYMKLRQTNSPLAAGINDVQELSKTHEAIAGAKTQVLHRIQTHYLPLYFPEVDRFRQNSRSDWFFAFLDRFPTPASITALDKPAFIAAAWSVVGRKVSKERLLSDIYETAKTSIGLPIPLEAPAIRMFRLVIAEARSLIRQRNEIEAMADQLLAESQDYKRLRQIPGIGPIIALAILAEAGDLRRFGHHRQFLKFCGLDLSTQQSGTYRGQTKLSKYGNARLRRSLWLAAQVAIRQKENSDESASRVRHSRVQSSTTVRMRKRRPQVSWSDTKSSDQRSFGRIGIVMGARVPMARLRPPRRRTLRRSSR
jgi:transposase